MPTGGLSYARAGTLRKGLDGLVGRRAEILRTVSPVQQAPRSQFQGPTISRPLSTNSVAVITTLWSSHLLTSGDLTRLYFTSARPSSSTFTLTPAIHHGGLPSTCSPFSPSILTSWAKQLKKIPVCSVVLQQTDKDQPTGMTFTQPGSFTATLSKI